MLKALGLCDDKTARATTTIEHSHPAAHVGLQAEFLKALDLRQSSPATNTTVTVEKHLFKTHEQTTTAEERQGCAQALSRRVYTAPALRPLSKMVEYPGELSQVKQWAASSDVDVLGLDMYGWSALAKFASWNKVELLDVVLDHSKVDASHINSKGRNSDGFTALHAAIESGAQATVERLLCDGRCDLSLVDGKGRTPLALALEIGNTTAEKLLQDQ